MKKKSNLKGRLSYINKMYPQVTNVTDANASIQIEVTKRDCETAKPNEPDKCALAKALKRRFKAGGAVVGPTHTYIVKGKKAFRFKTSPAVQREIVSFDRHRDFAEGVYTISKISPADRLGRDRRRGDRHLDKNRKKVPRHKTVRVRNVFEK